MRWFLGAVLVARLRLRRSLSADSPLYLLFLFIPVTHRISKQEKYTQKAAPEEIMAMRAELRPAPNDGPPV